MTDRLKRSAFSGDVDTACTIFGQALKSDENKIEDLEKRLAALEKVERDKKSKNDEAPPTGATKNKTGARKHATFMAISTAPSINKTPVGPSMVPVPYVTIQNLSNRINTARSVKFNGCAAYLLDASTQPHCRGDEAGTGKGVRSGTVNGEVKPIEGSKTVRIEGKRVIRAGDACTMNGGNNPGIYVTTCTIGSTLSSQNGGSRFTTGHLEITRQSVSSKFDFQNWLDGAQLTPAQKLAALMQRDILNGNAFNRTAQGFGGRNVGPMLAPLEHSSQSEQTRTRNSLTIALLSVFGGPGAVARLAGMNEEKVAAANEIGAAAMGLAGTSIGLSRNFAPSAGMRTRPKLVDQSNIRPPASSGDGIRIAKITPKDGFHATASAKQAENVIKGIDADYLNPKSRFGKAFHVSEEP